MAKQRKKLLSAALAPVLVGAGIGLTGCSGNASPGAATANPCAPANPCAATNPCAAKACRICNPCADKCGACNPCAACRPCAAKCGACNPCAAYNPCAATCGACSPYATAGYNPCAPAHMGPQYISNGAALSGYDAVAYHIQASATPGNPRYVAEYNGVIWQFASADNRDLFVADPLRFAPAFDGWCSYAASIGTKAPGDPTVWKIVDRKLYVNFAPRAAELWERDIPGNIQKGLVNWPSVNPG